jgi:RNAse (barnase) inhibitor barstar
MNSFFSALCGSTPPWVVTCQEGDSLSETLRAVEQNTKEFFFASISGEKTNCISDFYSEFADLFNLPDYFGRNLNALIDSMEDEKITSKLPLVVVIRKAEKFLVDEPSEVLYGVLSAFNSIGVRWSFECSDGTEWDFPRRGFLVVLEMKK